MPHSDPAEQISTLRSTAPDIVSLHIMCAAVHDALPLMEHKPRLRWRINHADWSYLRRVDIAEMHAVQLAADNTWTLFGVPVDLIDITPDSWPQLVIINDRRVGR